jgi:uncharacterized protein YqjF (DUF2071 family)
MTLTHAAAGEIHATSRRLWPGPRPAGCDIRARPTGTPAPAAVGSLDHFLLERYLLYCASGRRIYRGQVHHHAYPAQTAEVLHLEETLLGTAGLQVAGPPLAHFARGVDVEIFSLETVAR